MGTRRCALLGVSAAVLGTALLVSPAPAQGADEVVFPPNEWVTYCDGTAFRDVNGRGDALATSNDSTTGWVYHLREGARGPLHADAIGAAINDTGLVVGSYQPNGAPSVGFVQDITTGEFFEVDAGLGTVHSLVAVTDEGLAVGNYTYQAVAGLTHGIFTYDHRTGEIVDLGGLGTGTASATAISGSRIVGVRGRTYAYVTGFVHDLETGATTTLQGFDGIAGAVPDVAQEYIYPHAIQESRIASTDWFGAVTPWPAVAVVEDIATGETELIGPDDWGAVVGDMNADGIVVGGHPVAAGAGLSRLSVVPASAAFAFDTTTGFMLELPSSSSPSRSAIQAVGSTGLAVGIAFEASYGDCAAVVQLRMPPHAPTGARVELRGETAVLTWSAPEFDGYDRDFTYVVRFDGVEVARLPAPLTTAALPSAPCAGGTYTVTAENAEGASAPSEGAVLVARSCSPAAPAVPVPAAPTFTG